jgi:hypothetical protein
MPGTVPGMNVYTPNVSQRHRSGYSFAGFIIAISIRKLLQLFHKTMLPAEHEELKQQRA